MILLLLMFCDVRELPQETRYADRIVENSVYTTTEGKKVFWLRQFVTYEKVWGGYRCTGYLVVNSDTTWEQKRLPNGYMELSFHSLAGKPRRVLTKVWTKAETTKDIEVQDRERGPRYHVLFGSYLGNMKDE